MRSIYAYMHEYAPVPEFVRVHGYALYFYAFITMYNLAETADDTDKPNILWSLTFEVTDSNDVTYDGCPTGVFVVPGPDARIDFEQSIAKVVDFGGFRVSQKALIENACLLRFCLLLVTIDCSLHRSVVSTLNGFCMYNV